MEKSNGDQKIKIAFIGDNGVGKTLLFMRVNNLIKNKNNYKFPKEFILEKENLINNNTNNGCLVNEKEIKIEDENNVYHLEIWDLSNTFNTFRFNRFPVTRKFYFVNDAQIIIICCEPRFPKTIETMKILYDISKIRADPYSIFVLCVTKSDLNYSEEELNDIRKYANDNGLELILTSSFKEDYGLGDNILKKFIIQYNKKKNLK